MLGRMGGATAKDSASFNPVALLRSRFDTPEAIIMLKLRRVVAVVAVTMGGTAVAEIINVGPGDSIQAAINAAMDGDEVVVAPGTYVD